MTQPPLTSPFRIADVEVSNRVLLAPLASIGNWFVRLQATRYGAGLAVSEMVSSYALVHRNRRTCEEMLRIHPDEPPIALQLFGPDPDVMREAAAVAASAGPRIIDLNMGCPVPKVFKTGAGAALLREPERAVAVARAAAEGSGLPVTVKLRSGIVQGDRSGLELAKRLFADAGVAGGTPPPRSAKAHHSGRADLSLVRELVEFADVPVIVSGGARTPARALAAYEESGADAVMIARGSLGNPWIFEQLVRGREEEPDAHEVVAELLWVIDRGVQHWGAARATRNLRKFYPWYLERLGITGRDANAYQRMASLEQVREALVSLEQAENRAPEERVGASL